MFILECFIKKLQDHFEDDKIDFCEILVQKSMQNMKFYDFKLL